MFSRYRSWTVLRVLGGLALAVVVGGSGSIVNPATVVAAPTLRDRGISWVDMGASFASLVPPAVWDVLGQPQTIDPGGDGVLNILLLGSDARSGTGVSRTDSIMIFSLKNGVLRAASIPRDTAKIPDPFNGGTFKGRVNAILKKLKNTSPNTAAALDKFEIVIENLLQIPIDEHVLITFAGFHAMVDVVDPISINTKEIKDGKYWDDPDRPKGVYFPARTGYQLYAFQPHNSVSSSNLCNGLWKTQGVSNQDLWCRRAMPYVRSRKGPGNSDWKRAARQQDFVYATIKDVDALGINNLTPLLNEANDQDSADQLHTSFPITIGNVQDLYSKLDNSSRGNTAVFGPSTYATHIPGTTAYKLKLDVVRNWANTNLQ